MFLIKMIQDEEKQLLSTQPKTKYKQNKIEKKTT